MGIDGIGFLLETLRFNNPADSLLRPSYGSILPDKPELVNNNVTNSGTTARFAAERQIS